MTRKATTFRELLAASRRSGDCRIIRYDPEGRMRRVEIQRARDPLDPTRRRDAYIGIQPSDMRSIEPADGFLRDRIRQALRDEGLMRGYVDRDARES